MEFVALGWLVYGLTGSALSLGLTGLAQALPRIVRVEQVRIGSRNRNLLRDMADGLTFVRRHEIFLALIGLVFFNSIFGMSYQLLMPIFARDILRVGSEGFGFLQTAGAAGGILGSLAAARLARAGSRGRRALLG